MFPMKVHEYPVTVVWQGGRDGKGSVTGDRSKVSSPVCVPPEFGGVGHGGTNPEELMAKSVAACYTITYGIIAANRKLPVSKVETSAVGEVTEEGPKFTYKKVTVRPQITMASDASDEQLKIAEEMAYKADGYCIITNAVRGSVEIIVEPTVVRG
jgi:peroxiredoxin-like protein